jgi:polysaccharide export outer membrane protein
VRVLSARERPDFRDRFKTHLPPPEQKIAIGDTLTVVIWESAGTGLFGNSLIDVPPRGGLPRRALGLSQPLGEASRRPGGEGPQSERLGQLLGGAAALLPGAIAGSRSAMPTRRDAAAAAGAGRGREARVAELAEQTGRPGTSIPDQLVGPDETITIPYAGRVIAAGRTPEELARKIEALLAPVALDPQALVILQRGAAGAVTVAGEAIEGARIPLPPGGDRLLDVIAAAGGAKTPVHETFVRLSRGGVTATVPLAVLVADPDQNIFARPGDVLILSREPQTVSVFGAAGKNAMFTFETERLSLSEALAKAGGLLDKRADPSAVFLMRYEPPDIVEALGQPLVPGGPAGMSPIVYRLDLSEANSYLLAKRFPVQDKDIIFVAEAKLVAVTRALEAISKITGPVTSGLLICQTTKNC